MLTYEELMVACELHGFKLVPQDKPKEYVFSAIARFERGFGPEYVNLKSVKSKTIHEAQKEANEQAATYFRDTEGLQNAVISEVRIRPE